MSTATLAPPHSAGGPARAAARPGLGRLTLVELRKMVDTRAGLWLQIATAGLTVAIMLVVVLAGSAEDKALDSMLSDTVQPASVLLPIIGILLVTSEWSQRTSLITFALVPQRSRVLAAKVLAGVLLALAAFVVCVVVAVIGTAAGGGAWSLPAGLFGQDLVYLVTGMITGVAFGAVLLNSAPAIVLYFALPLAWAAIGSLAVFEDAARWLDGTRSLAPLTEELLSGTQWAQTATTLALWMVLPLAIGAWRIARGEVR